MISIVIPLYNKSRYVQRAIDSVVQQTFQDWEIIVIDDGSTDGGYEKIAHLQSEKITLIRQRNQGVSAARNLGISIARFKYIAFLDADDYWSPEYLSAIFNGITSFPNAGIWCTSFSKKPTDLTFQGGSFKESEDYFTKSFWHSNFYTSSIVIEKTFFEKMKGFKPHLKKGEDLDVWIRAILFFGKYAYCSDTLVYYDRDDETSATRTPCHLSASILSDIVSNDYLVDFELNETLQKQFDIFREKLIYYNIFLFFRHHESYETMKKVLKKIRKRYDFPQIFYSLPRPFLKWFFADGKRQRIFRDLISKIFDKHFGKLNNY
jgi:glycosyltransferase involved in cell wall biosynthesis